MTLSEAPLLQAGACCAWSFLTATQTMDHAELIMSAEEAEYVHGYLMLFLKHWQGLSQLSRSQGKARWRMRPKMHSKR